MSQKIQLFGEIGRPLRTMLMRKISQAALFQKREGTVVSTPCSALWLTFFGVRVSVLFRQGGREHATTVTLFFQKCCVTFSLLHCTGWSPSLPHKQNFLCHVLLLIFYIFYMQYILSSMPKIGFSNPNIILLTSFIVSN